MAIGDRVKALRIARGMSQGELARAIKISQPALSKIESNAASNVRGSTLNALAKILDVSPQWLESGNGSPAKQVTVGVDHSELISIYDHLNEANRNAWMTTGRALLSSQDNVPSVMQPFKSKPKLKL